VVVKRYRRSCVACGSLPLPGLDLCRPCAPVPTAPVSGVRLVDPLSETGERRIVRIGFMQPGHGDRRTDCNAYLDCLDEAVRQLPSVRRGGSAYCPDGCEGWRAADRGAELDEMAMSRSGGAVPVLGGGGWRRPTTGTGGER
jgi:hypothetical protein